MMTLLDNQENVVKIKLKNSTESALVDASVYNYLETDEKLKKIDLINNLRRHSSGCVVFQKNNLQPDGSYKTKTIYLHKLVAEKFKGNERTQQKKLVGAVNGNKLDCRIENIEWRTRSVASRKRKTTSKLGYTGVYKENNRFRAIISKDGRAIHIGMYPTAEAAAVAYNKKSIELFGTDGKINIIK